jgi:hypothetical protein
MTPQPHPAIRIPARLTNATRRRLLRDAPEGLSRPALTKAYLEDERSICSIAREVGCSARTVLLHLALHGIPFHSTWRRR